ncbi:alpha/beta hydrolase [Desulfovibrio sp. OttesenSCG-928-F20]|nr:alpha/beta hydrolase [Desulfovibrio sp. OttesenSCG-928-F20]
MNKYPHIKAGDTIQILMEHPAFKGFGQHLLTRDDDVSNLSLPISRIHSLLPYHGSVDVDTVLAGLNHMVDDAAAGKTIFYDFYSEQQKRSDPTKASTGLFFFRGEPGAPFAVVCPGGGFSYVGSVHEGFPYAMELSKKGFNAFVLRYRVGQSGNAATSDLAAALSYIFANAEDLAVGTASYSLWGSSAGARMVAYIGSHGAARFGGKQLPSPSALIMAYTGHAEFTPNDPPTFATVSADDPIVRVSNVENRIAGMRDAGIDVELRKCRNAGHGFGLGVGTDAAGWMEDAVRFWEKQLPAASAGSRNNLPG